MSVITYEREYREEFQDHTSALERLAKVEQERDTLLAALKAVEWVPSGRTYVDNEAPIMVCAWQCGNRRHMGHAPDCQRQAAIAAVEGE